MIKKRQLPIGVQDYLPDECYNKGVVESKLASVYERHGYRRVELPTLEYLDTFNYSNEANQDNVFKMMDYDGRLLALRPDPTLQISRLKADSRNNKTERLYYILNSYEFTSTKTAAGRTREFAQAGVELLGAKGTDADLELVILAIETLIDVGVNDFKIEIGHMGFFKGIMSCLNLKESDIEDIRLAVNQKDIEAIKIRLEEKAVAPKDVQTVLKIPKLFGAREILDKAKELCSNDGAKNAVLELDSLMNALEILGLDEYVTIDLGVVQELSYYTGIVIKGITPNLGQPLLNGGRYDGLSKFFGAEFEAVGFSVGIKRLLISLEKQGALSKIPPLDYAYYIQDTASLKLGFDTIKELHTQGLRTERVYAANEQELAEHCRQNRIPHYILFKDNTAIKGEI